MRAELLGQIANAQFDLDTTAATGSSALLAQADAQRQQLTQLLRAIAGTARADLPALRAQIAAAVSGSASLAAQARNEASATTTAPELATAAATSRSQVQATMRDLHRFDPYLQFASPGEEAEYRRRETERRAHIEREQAKGTPEGELNAAGEAVAQMTDAHAHGAGESPEFARRWDALIASTRALRDQMRHDGRSTAEMDDRLRDNLRGILRRKGLSEAEIDARLAAHGNDPLLAARAIVRTDEDLRALALAAPVAVATADVKPVQNLAEAMAEFRAAGIVAAEQQAGEPPAHGVTVAQPGLSESRGRA